MSETIGDDLVEHIRSALRRVIDPELGYNVLDLRLIYSVAADAGGGVRIIMTTTTRGCPATNYLKDGVSESVWSVPGVEFVDVTLTYDPPWKPWMMTTEAKQFLGIADGSD